MSYILTSRMFDVLDGLFIGEVCGCIDFNFDNEENDLIQLKLVEGVDWEENEYCYFSAMRTLQNFLKITPIGDFDEEGLDKIFEDVRDCITIDYNAKFLLNWLSSDEDHIKIVNEVIQDGELYDMYDIMRESFYRYEEHIATIVFNMLKFYMEC